MTETNNKLRAVFLAALMFLAVFAGSVALAGSAAAGHDTVEEADDSWAPGSSAWQGQQLYFEANNGGSATYEIRPRDPDAADNVGGIEDQFVLANGESTVIDTSDLDTSDYVITRDGRSNVAATDEHGVEQNDADGNTQGSANTHFVEINEQDLDASFANDEVRTGSQTELELDSVRASYDVEVTSEDLSADEINQIFSNGQTTDDGVVLSAGDTNTADFSNVEPGNYTFDVDVTDSSASDTANVTVAEEGTDAANFDESVFTETQGDVATLTMSTENVDDTVTLTIGSEEMNYEVELEVRPDEDGNIGIQMNTYLAGQSDTTADEVFTSAEGTEIVSAQRNTDPLNNRLETGLYDLVLSETNGDREYDVGALDISDRSTDSLSVYTSPNDLNTEEAIRNGKEDGSVTEADNIAEEDTVLLEVEATGIYGLLDEEWDGSEASNLEADNELNLDITQTNPGPNREAKQVDVSDADVIVDSDKKTFYVVLDSSAANVEAGEDYEATFTATENYDYTADEEESVNDSFSMVERSASLDVDNDGYVTVAPDEGQVISGETSVAPGEELIVRTRATGESPFLKSQTATVETDGTYSAEFDFSDISEGQEFDVSVQGGNFADAVEAPGRVAEADPASVSVSDQDSEDGDVVTVDSAYLPNGGFLVVHDDSLDDGATFDSVVGTSDYLSEGEHSDVEIELDEAFDEGDHTVIVMAHEDTNDNQEFDFADSEGEDDNPYEDAEGESVTDRATYTVEEESTPTPTEDDDGEVDDDDGQVDDDSQADDDDDDGETDDQAGFGAVIALVALLGAALLAARRNAF